MSGSHGYNMFLYAAVLESDWLCVNENCLFVIFQKNVEELLQRKGGGLSQDGSTVCHIYSIQCISF